MVYSLSSLVRGLADPFWICCICVQLIGESETCMVLYVELDDSLLQLSLLWNSLHTFQSLSIPSPVLITNSAQSFGIEKESRILASNTAVLSYSSVIGACSWGKSTRKMIHLETHLLVGNFPRVHLLCFSLHHPQVVAFCILYRLFSYSQWKRNLAYHVMVKQSSHSTECT